MIIKYQLERWALVITVETVDSVYFGICLKFSIRYREEEEEKEKREGGREGVTASISQISHDVPWRLLDFLTDLNWGARASFNPDPPTSCPNQSNQHPAGDKEMNKPKSQLSTQLSSESPPRASPALSLVLSCTCSRWGLFFTFCSRFTMTSALEKKGVDHFTIPFLQKDGFPDVKGCQST